MRTLHSSRAAVVSVTLSAVLALSACSSNTTTDDAAGPVTLENCGQQLSLEGPADAAITVNQGATESALAVGASEQLKATAYLDDAIAPQWAAEYAAIPVLSDEYPSREAVLEQRPDLIAASYASAFDDKALGTRASFAELGIATYVSPFACEDKAQRATADWAAIESELSDYGVLFGREEAAATLIEQQRATIVGITERAAGKGRTVLWYDSGTTTPFVGGNAGGPQLIMDATGADNVFAGLDGAWADGNWETVLQADPDVIVLADASWDTAADKRRYLENDPALKGLRAVREGRFVMIPFSETTPGPRTVDGAAALDAYFTGQ